MCNCPHASQPFSCITWHMVLRWPRYEPPIVGGVLDCQRSRSRCGSKEIFRNFWLFIIWHSVFILFLFYLHMHDYIYLCVNAHSPTEARKIASSWSEAEIIIWECTWSILTLKKQNGPNYCKIHQVCCPDVFTVFLAAGHWQSAIKCESPESLSLSLASRWYPNHNAGVIKKKYCTYYSQTFITYSHASIKYSHVLIKIK